MEALLLVLINRNEVEDEANEQLCMHVHNGALNTSVRVTTITECDAFVLWKTS